MASASTQLDPLAQVEDVAKRCEAQPTGAPRNLTDSAENAKVLSLASALLRLGSDVVVSAHDAVKSQSASRLTALGPIVLEALYCARSRLGLVEAAGDGGGAVHLTVIFAAYKETLRMQPRHPETNPHGEDCLREKVRQLEWLFSGVGNASWDLVVVDDGCPAEPPSCVVASEIVKGEGWKSVKVLRLADAISSGAAVARSLKSTDDSRKGGSVLYGMWHSLTEAGRPDGDRHIVLYTDADLSANLGMCGLAVEAAICRPCCPIVCGARYGEAGSLLVKGAEVVCEPEATGDKPDKNIILFRHFIRRALLPCLAQVKDTQCGFKAFRATPTLAGVLEKVTSFNATFDVDLLVNIWLQESPASRPTLISPCPIIFVEDFALSTMATSKQVEGRLEAGEGHLAMIRQIVHVYDALMATSAPADGRNADILAWVRDLDLIGYRAAIANMDEQDKANAGKGYGEMFEGSLDLQHMST